MQFSFYTIKINLAIYHGIYTPLVSWCFEPAQPRALNLTSEVLWSSSWPAARHVIGWSGTRRPLAGFAVLLHSIQHGQITNRGSSEARESTVLFFIGFLTFQTPRMLSHLGWCHQPGPADLGHWLFTI